MTQSAMAVFLSYASEDAGAARRICDALRAAGLSVWFDQSELRGGDAWDRQIRTHIHDCGLFVPIISANTQARSEGYFRLEWKLAVERTRLMSDRVPFLVPVVIDDTRDQDADVPDAFRTVQWTRLPAGETRPAFTERVSQLLARDVQPAGAAAGARDATSARRKPAPDRAAKWYLRPVVLAIAIAVVVVGYFVVDRFVLSTQVAERERAPPPTREPAAARQSPVPAKSVAVLPFIDMSEKKDQEYLSDGLSEELINLLAKVPDISVPARTSSFYFKGKQTTIAEIATTLGVAHVLEGSVRKAGNTVRITTQLIRATDGHHLWSETYDRDLKDIFRLQDEIAASVVQALTATLLAASPRSEGTTTNLDAYTLTLQGRLWVSNISEVSMRQAISTFERAVALDPSYAPAWVELSNAYFEFYDYGYGPSARYLPRARAAAEKAVALAPAFGAAHEALGWAKLYSDFDWHGAQVELEAARRADPDKPQPDWLRLYSGCVSGPCYEQFQRDLTRAIARDPMNASRYADRGNTHYRALELAAAERDLRHALELSPDMGPARFNLTHVLILRHDADGAMTMASAAPNGPWRSPSQVLANDALAKRPEADHLLKAMLTGGNFFSPYIVAKIYAARGDRSAALDWLERAYREKDHFMTWLKVDPGMQVLNDDPRFVAVLDKMNFPQ